jgi:hypothetical protein
LLSVLVNHHIRFIVVGGVAARAHGCPIHTDDLDIVYKRDASTRARLVQALRPFRPTLRGLPLGIDLPWTAETLAAGVNFPLNTHAWPLDLIGELVGGGRYEDLIDHTVLVRAGSIEFRILDRDTLMRVKHAAGRAQDLYTVALLRAY